MKDIYIYIFIDILFLPFKQIYTEGELRFLMVNYVKVYAFIRYFYT